MLPLPHRCCERSGHRVVPFGGARINAAAAVGQCGSDTCCHCTSKNGVWGLGWGHPLGPRKAEYDEQWLSRLEHGGMVFGVHNSAAIDSSDLWVAAPR